VALIEQVPPVKAALAAARRPEAAEIASALEAGPVVGVLGEAEVGKTATITDAIASLDEATKLVTLDLDGVASEEHAAFLLAKGIARAEMGAVDFSLLTATELIPSRVAAGRTALAELLGVQGLEEALREWPSGELPLATAIAALETVSARSDVVLWIDHLEAPSLTPRHPLDLERLLWATRALVQRGSGPRVLLTGREGIGARALAPKAAFHQQGQWLTLDLPSPETWGAVAASLDLAGPGRTAELTDLLDRHPASMLLALARRLEGDDARHPYQLVQDMVAADTGLTARAMQHARSLHRLGGQVLIQIASGQIPSAAARRGRATPQEIHKILGRLRLAGLIRRNADGWAVVNPLVAMGIRQQVAWPVAVPSS
jgi:hypothetical protein